MTSTTNSANTAEQLKDLYAKIDDAVSKLGWTEETDKAMAAIADALRSAAPAPAGGLTEETMEALWDSTALRDDRVLSFGRAVEAELLSRSNAAQPNWKPGDHAIFRGKEMKVVAFGDKPGTFDLHPLTYANNEDSWRNVPPSELTGPIPKTAQPEAAQPDKSVDDDRIACSSCGLTMRQSYMLAGIAAQPAPMPVAWMTHSAKGLLRGIYTSEEAAHAVSGGLTGDTYTPLYAALPPSQPEREKDAEQPRNGTAHV